MTTTKDATKLHGKWSDIVIQKEQIGVYQVLVSRNKAFNLSKPYRDLVDSAPAFKRLVYDIYEVSPGLFCCYVATKLVEGIRVAFVMQLSSNLLKTVRNLAASVQRLY